MAPFGPASGELLLIVRLADGELKLFVAIRRSISAHLTCACGSEKHEGNNHRVKANSGVESQSLRSVVTTAKCSFTRKHDHQGKGHERIVKECAASDACRVLLRTVRLKQGSAPNR